MLKMTDIADMAEVSIATVGRVIHNNGYVSQENRIKIEKIIKETGFVPNRTAQGLKGNKSRLIGHLTIFNPNMLYEEIAKAVNLQAHKMGYQVITMVLEREPEEAQKQIQELIGRRVDGVIITSNPFVKKKHIELLEKAGIPVIFVEREYGHSEYDFIKVDDIEGAYRAVKQMVSAGHREIGYIGPKLKYEVEKLRFEGYQKALKECGAAINKSRIVHTDSYSTEDGKEAAGKILGQTSNVTAIFVTSDVLVCGVLQYCYEKQIRIPRNLSIIGYDNTLSSYTAPKISSMKLPLEEIAVQVIDLLTLRMKEPTRKPTQYLVRPVIVDRGSVIPIPR
ncbi:MAG: LacI family DNA-binding transcriptional regulator [Lachnospiraceae bacterium]